MPDRTASVKARGPAEPLQQLAHEALLALVIEGDRKLVRKALGEAMAELFQDRVRDRRQLELLRVLEIHPGELDQLRVRSDHAADFIRHHVAVNREEARVEALRTPRRRDRTRHE